MHILFDFGATNSFASSMFVWKYNLPYVPLEYDLCVSIPIRNEVISNQIGKSHSVQIEGKELIADLIVIDTHNFDIILGIE